MKNYKILMLAISLFNSNLGFGAFQQALRRVCKKGFNCFAYPLRTKTKTPLQRELFSTAIKIRPKNFNEGQKLATALIAGTTVSLAVGRFLFSLSEQKQLNLNLNLTSEKIQEKKILERKEKKTNFFLPYSPNKRLEIFKSIFSRDFFPSFWQRGGVIDRHGIRIPADKKFLKEYEYIKHLGAGHSGIVGLYKHVSTGKLVAIKKIRAITQETLKNEVGSSILLNGEPDITAVEEFHLQGGVLYIVMEVLEKFPTHMEPEGLSCKKGSNFKKYASRGIVVKDRKDKNQRCRKISEIRYSIIQIDFGIVCLKKKKAIAYLEGLVGEES